MAQLYATGAVDLWVRFVGDSEPQFLGHGETAPDIEVTPAFVPFFADIGGPTIPLDLLETGSSGRVSVTLNRLNYNVLRAVQSRARNLTFPTIDPGFSAPGQGGMPLILSGCVPKLYLNWPFANKATYQNFVNGNLPDGYRFMAAILDPEVIKSGCATAHKVSLTWWCLRAYDRMATNNYGRGSLRLYDQDMSDIEGLFPN